MSTILTVEETTGSMGIDYADEVVKKRIERLIDVADKYLQGAIGKEYPRDDARAKELALLTIEDLYDRGVTDKVSKSIEKLANDFSMQLRIEMRVRNEI